MAESSKDKIKQNGKSKRQSSRRICGTSGEIAGAVARSFAQHGAKVYVTARNLDAVKALAQEIKASGGSVGAAKVDALNEAEIDNFLKKVVADNGRLDAVFNGTRPVNCPHLTEKHFECPHSSEHWRIHKVIADKKASNLST
ncbi:MAG: family oxidoreductase [Mucilaginibacter sp.]|nr:family oxidoreductase [Mucilaginibacter sp.]